MLWDLPMQDSAGSRITIQTVEGPPLRVCLGATPVHPLPAVALEALRAVLPAHHWHRVFCAQLAARGGPYPATRYG